MIRWEQMAFLGNPEYAVEFTPINFARFADECGGKGFTITEARRCRTNHSSSDEGEKTHNY